MNGLPWNTTLMGERGGLGHCVRVIHPESGRFGEGDSRECLPPEASLPPAPVLNCPARMRQMP